MAAARCSVCKTETEMVGGTWVLRCPVECPLSEREVQNVATALPHWLGRDWGRVLDLLEELYMRRKGERRIDG